MPAQTHVGVAQEGEEHPTVIPSNDQTKIQTGHKKPKSFHKKEILNSNLNLNSKNGLNSKIQKIDLKNEKLNLGSKNFEQLPTKEATLTKQTRSSQ